MESLGIPHTFTEQDIEVLLREMDMDGSGTVTSEEFLSAVRASEQLGAEIGSDGSFVDAIRNVNVTRVTEVAAEAVDLVVRTVKALLEEQAEFQSVPQAPGGEDRPPPAWWDQVFGELKTIFLAVPAIEYHVVPVGAAGPASAWRLAIAEQTVTV